MRPKCALTHTHTHTHTHRHMFILFFLTFIYYLFGRRILKELSVGWRRLLSFLKIFIEMFYLFLRERETEYELGRGRERGRQNPQSRLQALSCQHGAWCGTQTREPRNHDLSWSRTPNWLSPPGAPTVELFKKKVYAECHINTSRAAVGKQGRSGVNRMGTLSSFSYLCSF